MPTKPYYVLDQDFSYSTKDNVQLTDDLKSVLPEPHLAHAIHAIPNIPTNQDAQVRQLPAPYDKLARQTSLETPIPIKAKDNYLLPTPYLNVVKHQQHGPTIQRRKDAQTQVHVLSEDFSGQVDFGSETFQMRKASSHFMATKLSSGLIEPSKDSSGMDLLQMQAPSLQSNVGTGVTFEEGVTVLDPATVTQLIVPIKECGTGGGNRSSQAFFVEPVFDGMDSMDVPFCDELGVVAELECPEYVEGQVITCKAKVDNCNDNEQPPASFKWYKGTERIRGATSSTYTIRPQDFGRKIKCKCTVQIRDQPVYMIVCTPTIQALPPSISNIQLAEVGYVGKPLQVTYDYVGGVEGESLYHWSTSVNGVQWKEVRVVKRQEEAGPEGQGQYITTADDLHLFVKCEVLAIRSDGVAAEARATAQCWVMMHEDDRNALQEAVQAGIRRFLVYGTGQKLTHVQLTNNAFTVLDVSESRSGSSVDSERVKWTSSIDVKQDEMNESVFTVRVQPRTFTFTVDMDQVEEEELQAQPCCPAERDGVLQRQGIVYRLFTGTAGAGGDRCTALRS
mmetsp:Transcript_79478/g.140271  ORF Transcript_79478/g.140271 Transcript_79478/m.140271 type:complete len:562 (-) Transcript_79478:664-2349(-)